MFCHQSPALRRAATPPSSTKGSSVLTYVSVQVWPRVGGACPSNWRVGVSSQVRCWETCSSTCSANLKCTKTLHWAPSSCTTTTTTSWSRWRSECLTSCLLHFLSAPPSSSSPFLLFSLRRHANCPALRWDGAQQLTDLILYRSFGFYGMF